MRETGAVNGVRAPDCRSGSRLTGISLTRPAGVKRFLPLFLPLHVFFLLDQAHLYAFAQERRVALPIF